MLCGQHSRGEAQSLHIWLSLNWWRVVLQHDMQHDIFNRHNLHRNKTHAGQLPGRMWQLLALTCQYSCCREGGGRCRRLLAPKSSPLLSCSMTDQAPHKPWAPQGTSPGAQRQQQGSAWWGFGLHWAWVPLVSLTARMCHVSCAAFPAQLNLEHTVQCSSCRLSAPQVGFLFGAATIISLLVLWLANGESPFCSSTPCDQPATRTCCLDVMLAVMGSRQGPAGAAVLAQRIATAGCVRCRPWHAAAPM